MFSKVKILIASIMMISASVALAQTNEQTLEEETFKDEKKTMCEAVMCLATNAGTPHECDDSIEEYYSIKVFENGIFRPDKTMEKRRDFLEGCPGADDETIDTAQNNGENNGDNVNNNGAPEECQHLSPGPEREQCSRNAAFGERSR